MMVVDTAERMVVIDGSGFGCRRRSKTLRGGGFGKKKTNTTDLIGGRFTALSSFLRYPELTLIKYCFYNDKTIKTNSHLSGFAFPAALVQLWPHKLSLEKQNLLYGRRLAIARSKSKKARLYSLQRSTEGESYDRSISGRFLRIPYPSKADASQTQSFISDKQLF